MCHGDGSYVTIVLPNSCIDQEQWRNLQTSFASCFPPRDKQFVFYCFYCLIINPSQAGERISKVKQCNQPQTICLLFDLRNWRLRLAWLGVQDDDEQWWKMMGEQSKIAIYCDFSCNTITFHSKSHQKSHFVAILWLCMKRIAYLCSKIAIYWLNCSRSALLKQAWHSIH